MRGKTAVSLAAFILLVISIAAIAAAENYPVYSITKSGVIIDYSKNNKTMLEFKHQECLAYPIYITDGSVDMQICGKAAHFAAQQRRYIDIDNDKIDDIIVQYYPLGESKARMFYKLTYNIQVNIDQKPIIEEIAPEQENIIVTETAINDATENSEDKTAVIDELMNAANSEDNSSNVSQQPILDAVKKSVSGIPYIKYVAMGIIILALLIAVIHFSSGKGDKFLDLILDEDDEKPKKKKKKPRK